MQKQPNKQKELKKKKKRAYFIYIAALSLHGLKINSI